MQWRQLASQYSTKIACWLSEDHSAYQKFTSAFTACGVPRSGFMPPRRERNLPHPVGRVAPGGEPERSVNGGGGHHFCSHFPASYRKGTTVWLCDCVTWQGTPPVTRPADVATPGTLRRLLLRLWQSQSIATPTEIYGMWKALKVGRKRKGMLAIQPTLKIALGGKWWHQGHCSPQVF